jgi:hypothetical protein
MLRFALLIALPLYLGLAWRAAGDPAWRQESPAVRRCTHGWQDGYTWQYSLEQWQKITECAVWKPPYWSYQPFVFGDAGWSNYHEEWRWTLIYPEQDRIVGWTAEKKYWLNP